MEVWIEFKWLKSSKMMDFSLYGEGSFVKAGNFFGGSVIGNCSTMETDGRIFDDGRRSSHLQLLARALAGPG
jgi:hypothetical protein